MRDVYLSDASERIDAYALSHGELITRNGSQLHSRSLGASENKLLSQKLDEQKQQFLSQARSLIEAYIEKEDQLSRLLPRDIQDALKKCVSLSLLPLQNFLQGLSFCDVRTEILRGWLDAEPSSSPITDETHPTDSQSTGRDESVADEGFRSPTDAELQEHGCPELIEPRARQFLCNLPDTELKLISCDGMSRWLQEMLVRLAEDEIHRRRDL